MAFEREELTSFDSKSPAYRFKLWVRVVTPESTYYHVFWRRLAAAAVLAAVAAWLGAAGAVWGFLRYGREWEDVRYWDVAFIPLERQQFRLALGKFYTARGLVEMEKKNFWYARDYLIAGLRHAPTDLQVRRTVATSLVRFGLLPRALDVLAEGLRFNPDLDYLKLTFGWLNEARQAPRTLRLAQDLLPAQPDGNLLHQFIALHAAMAHYDLGRYGEAERVIREWGLLNSLEGHLVLARCDWDRGAERRALDRLEKELPRFAKRDELYTELIRLHRLAGNYEAARRFALLRQFNDPRGPGPRIDLLYSYLDTDDRVARERETAAFLATFAGDEKALLLLARFAAHAGDDALLTRLVDQARARGWALEPFQVQQALAAIQAGEYARAVALLTPAAERRAPESSGAAASPPAEPAAPAGIAPEERPRPPLWLGLRVVALFGDGRMLDAGAELNRLIEGVQPYAEEVSMLARELRRVAGAAPAAMFLRRACEIDPLNEAARAELVRLEAEAGERAALGAAVEKLLTQAKPVRPALEEALLALDQPEDAPLVARIRAALRPGPDAGP
jgi:tetratricopeptide (TPR) repeat protein